MTFPKSLTCNITPVRLSIRDGWDGEIEIRAQGRPAGLGDPDPYARFDAVDDGSGLGEGLVVDVEALFDTAAFEIGVSMLQVKFSQTGVPLTGKEMEYNR